MARKLDDIFDECYERIRSGESLESCLRSYPQYRSQLDPLLRTTFDIGRRASYIQPRPEFRHWARVRIESVQQYPRRTEKAETRLSSAWLRHGWALVVTAGIIVILTTGSTMAASSQSLPGEPLYPVKLATEQVQRTLTVTPDRKAEFETNVANTRADELQALATTGKTEEVSQAAARYDDQFDRAVQAIVAVGGTAQESPYVPPPTVPTPAVTPPPPVTMPTPVTPVIPTPVIPTPVTPIPVTVSENTTPSGTSSQPAPVAPPPVVPADNTTPSAVTPPPAPVTPTSNETTTTPTSGETPTPTATTTNTTSGQGPAAPTVSGDNKANKTNKWKTFLENSKDKSISALQDAKEKASQKDKSDWQQAIDTISKKDQKSINDHHTSGQSGDSGQSTNKSDNNTAPKPSASNQNKNTLQNWPGYHK
jgi:hypothetical protein